MPECKRQRCKRTTTLLRHTANIISSLRGRNTRMLLNLFDNARRNRRGKFQPVRMESSDGVDRTYGTFREFFARSRVVMQFGNPPEARGHDDPREGSFPNVLIGNPSFPSQKKSNCITTRSRASSQKVTSQPSHCAHSRVCIISVIVETSLPGNLRLNKQSEQRK